MGERELPECGCGSKWEGGGGVFSSLCQRYYKCAGCGKQSVLLSSAGGNLFAMPASGNEIPQKGVDWINSTVLPCWRANCTSGTPKYGERVPTPPRIPGDAIRIWLNHVAADGTHTWEYVDPDKTQNMAIPIDPIRVRHDALFKEVFDAVGIPERVRVEIPNRYYKDLNKNEPWFCIELGEVILIVGPRKRVINIEMTCKGGKTFDSLSTPFDHTVLDAVAKKDQVTYSSSDVSISIHAWGKDKAIEYLGTLVKAVPVLDRMAEIT